MVSIQDPLCATATPSRTQKNLLIFQTTGIAVGYKWPWNILWFDEAHFTLDEAVNNQNYRIWGSACPNIVHEHFLHSDYITVWCGFTVDFILDLLFFEQRPSQSS